MIVQLMIEEAYFQGLEAILSCKLTLEETCYYSCLVLFLLCGVVLSWTPQQGQNVPLWCR